jgi:hypothetical protein
MGSVRQSVLFTAALLPVLLSGCAKQLAVTYMSDPPGATLYQGQENFGYTPKTLYYKISVENKERGKMTLQGMSVRWASGATASSPSVIVDLSIGANQQLTFLRPESVAGREIDIQFALELERLRLAQQQADAQRAAMAWQQFQNSVNQLNQVNQQIYQQPQSLPMNCISSAVGNTIVTNCR